jgi:integrative and conjugative element protein (TIGR02256 family)
MIVWLDAQARHALEQEALQKRVVETGGALFGYDDGIDVVVTAISGPGPKARHRPFTFAPERDFIDQEIKRIYEQGDGRFRYLGSWHSHPFGSPRPSPVDTTTAAAMALEPDVRLPRPVLVIQSLHPLRRQGEARLGALCAFRWSRARLRLEPADVRTIEVEPGEARRGATAESTP